MALVCIRLLAAWLLLSSHTVAGADTAASHRVALQLTGPACQDHHAKIAAALSSAQGVHAVDLTLIPNHALVDIDARRLNADALVSLVGQAVSPNDCRPEPMESCVTPGGSRSSELPSRVPDKPSY